MDGRGSRARRSTSGVLQEASRPRGRIIACMGSSRVVLLLLLLRKSEGPVESSGRCAPHQSSSGYWSFLLCGVGLARRAEAPPSSLEACASLPKPLGPGQTELSQVARAAASPHPKTDEACPTVSRHSQALKPASHRNLRFRKPPRNKSHSMLDS